MAMHDVEKTTIRSGYQNAKRMRRRKRLMPLYTITVLLLTVCLGVALSMTLFFNVAAIELSGSSPQYTPSEIVEAGDVHKGDNLLRLDTEKIAENIEEELIYVESAEVSKRYPDAVTIEIRECREAYNIFFDNGILLTSASGKIIANSAEAAENLPVIYGFNPTVLTPGKHAASSDKTKNEIFTAFAEIMNTELSIPITSIDMSDKYNIVVMFDDRIEFSMGNWNEITYKITLAEAVISRLGTDKEGYLTMIGSNQCSFRDKISVDLENQFSSSIGTTTAAASGEGQTTETTTVTTGAGEETPSENE
ncbi:MAG: FtsQ-type POTRA domain-containing protein [Ruminococcus sp.]|nr:FtsQ-type POTRA domain-containing protein [Ruminococcus sp.]